ncbi:MAG: hypothetical protein RR860_18205, partial [Janthinobacterium sp.]
MIDQFHAVSSAVIGAAPSSRGNGQILIPGQESEEDGFVRQLVAARAIGGEVALQQGIQLR